MLNQFILVGRLVDEPKELIIEGDKKEVDLKLAVQRSYKNELGEYDIDIVDFSVLGSMAEHIKHHCSQGDMLGLKGRVKSKEIDGKSSLQIVAERVTFLSSKNMSEENIDKDMDIKI